MKVLVVPAGCTDLAALRDWIVREGRVSHAQLERAASYARAASHLRVRSYDAVLCDLEPNEDAGLELLSEVRARGENTPFVLIVDRARSDTVTERVRTLGPASCLVRQELSLQRLGDALLAVPGGSWSEPDRVVDIAPAMIWKTDAEGGMTNFSQRWCLFTGRTEEKERGHGWLDGVHPVDLDRWTKLYSSALAEEREFKIDLRIRSASNDFHWVRHHGIPCFTAERVFAGYLGSSFEITDLKQAQESTLAQLDQLSHTNRELESFVHTASHDLHEPLRTLESQLSALGGSEGESSQLLSDAADSVHRMQVLLNDLLECARVSTRGEPPEPTDLSAPLDWALANLRRLIEETGAHITQSPLPIVDADATQIAQVFQNLIGNAIKFRGEEPVLVQVGTERRQNDWLIWVRDNGIGIALEHQERIFELFGRAPGQDVNGRGIGLTICRKIIERHEGRIWVESEPGKGSAFFITLPRN